MMSGEKNGNGYYKPAVFPGEEKAIKSILNAALREIEASDVILVCGWSGKYDPGLLNTLKKRRESVFCVNKNPSAPVCGIGCEVFSEDVGVFAVSLAKALGLKEKDVKVDPKKLILAYPNWVIKEFLENLSGDLAKV